MIILAFDTATTACSAALWRDGVVVAHEIVAMDRGHAEALMPMVTRVMEAAGADFPALDRIAVTLGPGAFTGLRIGLAAAHGIALATGVGIVGVTTLEALAHAVPKETRGAGGVLAVIDAKRADVYAQFFDANLVPVTPPRALLPEDLPALMDTVTGPVVLVGDGAGRAEPILTGAGIPHDTAVAPGWPDAAVVAALAAGRAAPNGNNPAPLYLRPPQAVRPAHGGRLRP